MFRVCDVVVSTECGYYYCVEGSQQQQARRPVDQTASNDQENRTVISQFCLFALAALPGEGALCFHLVCPAVYPLPTWRAAPAATLIVGQHADRQLATPATMAVGQHAIRAGKSIPVPTWTRPGGRVRGGA